MSYSPNFIDSSVEKSEDEVEVMSNGNSIKRQQIRIYDFTQHPHLISSSLLPLNNSLGKVALLTSSGSRLDKSLTYIIEDQDQVPRPSVLYRPGSHVNIEDSTFVLSPDNQGGTFILDKSLQFEEMFSGVVDKAMPTNDTKELADIKTELQSMKTQQGETLDTVKQLHEQINRNEERQTGQSGQLQRLIETTDRLVAFQQELNRLLQTQQHKFDELGKRLSKVEGLMVPPSRGRTATLIKTSEPQFEDPWEKPCLTCIGTFSGHDSPVTCLVTNQNHLMSGSSSGEIRIWDVATLKCVMQACFTKDAISCMVISEEVELLIVASESCSIFLINLTTMKIASFHDEAHKGGIFAMCIADEYLFTSSLECIKIWKIEKFRIVHEHTLEGLPHNVRALHFDAQQGLLYSGAHNSVHGWSPRSPFQLMGKIESKNLGTIFSLTATEDHLFVGTYNQSIHVLNKSTFQTVKIMQSHIGAITSLITSPLEGHVISGSMDTSIVVWHTPILLAIQKLQRHRDTVNALAIVNEYLFSAGADCEIKNWTNVPDVAQVFDNFLEPAMHRNPPLEYFIKR